MIQRLKLKNIIDFYDFISSFKDNFNDFYITENLKRIFFTDLNLIKKILKRQECFGKFDNQLKALCIIYKEKNFRTYLKILGKPKDCDDLLRFIKWQFAKTELYCKVKKNNPTLESLKHNGFFPIANRGQEILLIKKKFIALNKIIPKDLGDENGKYNRKN